MAKKKSKKAKSSKKGNYLSFISDFKNNNRYLYNLLISMIFFIVGLLSFFRMGFIGSFTDNVFKYLFGSYIYIIYLIILCYPIILLFNISIKYKNYILSILFLIQLVFEIIFYNFNNYNLFDYKYVINHHHSYLGGGIIAFYIVKLLVYLLSYYGTLIIIVSTLLFIILIFINKHYPSFLSSIYDLLKIKNKETVSEINEQDLGTLVTNEVKNTNLENYNNINEKDFEVDMQSFKKDSKSRSNRSLHKDSADIYNSNTDSIITTETSTYDNYKLPSLDLLMDPIENKSISKEDIVNKSRILQSTFKDFGVEVKIVKAIVGPSITQFQILPTPGTKVSKIVNLSNDIALNLAAKDVRIEAPIPGKSLIGIEIPNDVNQLVTMKEVFVNDNDHSPLNVALGKDVSGNSIFARLDRMPHLLVAGSTGSGKSVCVNTIITSLLMKNKPDKVKLIMIDPKMVELSIYDGIPHLLTPVVTNPLKAADVLHKVVLEMEKRYKEFSIARVKNIEGYNKIAAKDEDYKEFPYIVVIIDELADLMMVVSKEVEESIARISQMARAAGIHLIIATQRPSVDVITGVIKTNIPSRIAFSVSSSIDSRTIIDKAGAETLLGKGDMLFQSAESSKPIRVQGAFLSDQEVENIVEYIKSQSDTEYDESMMPSESSSREGSAEETDPLYKEVLLFIAKTQKASASLLQRRFKIGYNRAARIIEMLEDDGYIGPSEGSKPRKVFLEPEFAENNE